MCTFDPPAVLRVTWCVMGRNTQHGGSLAGKGAHKRGHVFTLFKCARYNKEFHDASSMLETQ